MDEPTGWRHMSSAPMDGSRILVTVRSSEQGGAEVFGFTTQAYFLISCGLAVLVSGGDPSMTLSRLKATSAVHRLISPSEMGELFKVLAVGRGLTASLLGFSRGERSHSL